MLASPSTPTTGPSRSPRRLAPRVALAILGALGVSTVVMAACSPIPKSSTWNATGGGGSSSADTTATSGSGQGGDPDPFPTGGFGGAGSGGAIPTCATTPDEDQDHDGFSVAQGDCNDCDANVNPGAIEVIAPPEADGGAPVAADEDCDGMIDNVALPCDDALALADTDALHAAKALDLCKIADPAAPKSWGVLEARYVRANGAPTSPGPQTGLLAGFGPNVAPRKGARMVGLSSGHARIPGQPDACGTQTCFASSGVIPPPGFPQDVPNCPGASDINDDIGLEVKLRAPTNANGFGFDFFFVSFEYPEWVCTAYNDQFIALVSPPPQGSINGNVSFDSMNNPVSVNIAFFDVCQGCAAGTAQLQGTGFDLWGDAGGTGWLTTQAPVTGGAELTIRFAIWDTGDQALDSTTLLDNMRWLATGGTIPPFTGPSGPKG